ncbi:Protein pxr1 [Taphrina deformans PYCC 5710]|uniref:PinX1-related protein 1 n=1 Tax=Taphrina deformans (strain PYCC 5710 / ATCC 11124 / CBS 356.35 / IMI 108563 / JCM 9778 / NBRC 8474) TaxID=1097556 RepID=R4XHG1_TAPDE|nr:Protein pxr1 [Taphrina deformans PYCC 5710]|eukprot:CCG82852.1 Protein pxr1 [Taphrina deformans PYCC 5710]
MGLAGVKKSTRIGVDPRNTKWINNENGVGHRLLAAQGWTPGQGLGDSMKGRTVNIKTTYKDDTAGIGCTPQHSQEWAGLGAFNDIFARINSGEIAQDISDPGLKNKDRVLFMETKPRREGLDIRFVKGETFTSELSKAKFLESLGVGLGQARSTPSEKEQKRLRKKEKALRKERRAAKKAAKALKKESSSKSRKQDRSKTATPSSSSEDEVIDPSPVVVVVPPAAKPHGRFASRAKYQRAKLGSRMDASQLAEILGVKA